MSQEITADFIRRFSQSPNILGKVPARINLLGTHVEHQGGYVNTLAVNHSLRFAAACRKDSILCVQNQDASFPEVTFDLHDMLPASPISWNEYIRTEKIRPGHWENYIRAVCAYYALLKGKQLRQGLNIYFSGNIPVGAGLSSSSSLVVAMTLVLAKAHQWNYTPEELVEIAGRAEWYVGTRGGWGDHAAMIFGKKDRMAHFCFFPFQLEYFHFPSHLSVICAHSMVKAKKSGQARHIFNQRIACYHIGLKLIHQSFPELEDKWPNLRDINSVNLSEDTIYEILLSLPVSLNREELYQALPGNEQFLDELLETHPHNESYPIRNVISYGIAECERSRAGAVLMKNHQYHEFGRLMSISHDGDRVTTWCDNEKTPFLWQASEQNILAHRERCREIPFVEKVSSLALMPGAYHCSLPELDFIVDTVQSIPGVLGAKLTGAGLGGTVLILAEKDKEDAITSLLQEKYYEPRNFSPRIFACQSVDGAHIEDISR